KPVLERAFLATYDMKLDDVVDHLDTAVGSFRRTVSTLIPEMTRIPVRISHTERVKETPNASNPTFLFNLSRAEYEKKWGTTYKRPGLFTRILAFIVKNLPKIGPLKVLAFKIPTTQTEDLYIKSVNKTVENYSALLRQVNDPGFSLPNINCDTGKEPRAGEYAPSDAAVAKLLAKLSEKDLKQVSPPLRETILAFY